MTPLARELFSGARAMREEMLARYLIEAKCFDLTAVQGVLQHIARELMEGAEPDRGTGTRRTGPIYDHGDLLVVPARMCWFEFAGNTGIICEDHGDEIDFMAFGAEGPSIKRVGGGIIFPHDSHRCIIGPNHDLPDSMRPDCWRWGLAVAASIIAINAKHGIRCSVEQPHRGRARDLRQSGWGELLPHHVVTIDPRYSLVQDRAGGGSLRAFHFCRAHRRRLPSGTVTKVRAHWRGDPALGICQSDYRLPGEPRTAA